MKILIYVAIFVLKIIENSLSTLRIILIANGKKLLGAILNFIIALIWIFVTGTVIINVRKDPLKILFFALGSLVGSYLGSVIEEKLAIGNNVFMVIVNNEIAKKIENEIQNTEAISSLKLTSYNKTLLMITLPRRKTKKISCLIRKLDKNAIILSEKVKIISNI